MQTRLSVFCDKIIEAGWLAAVIITPLFFDPFSRRIFEPDRIALLRSIALLMLAAWLVKALESGLPRATRGDEAKGKPSLGFLRTPLVIPTLVSAGVYILTTITSIFPRVSLWGAYERMQGTYTSLSCMLIFLLALQTLRTREQLERLITAIVLVSLPVALYGIVQHYKLDPMPWTADIAGRVVSSIGNPIFVAAYLIMVVPLTVKRLMDSLSALIRSKPLGLLSTTCYVFILAAQLTCIVFTQSRGPFMGLLGGLFFFLLLLAISKGKRGLALTVLALAAGALLFLAIVNLPNTPLAAVRKMPYLGRLTRLFGPGAATKGRMLIWKDSARMIAAKPLRMLIGYGPETMYVAFNPFTSRELADVHGLGTTADRCHNEVLDVLVTRGLLGLAAYLLLFGNLFYYSFKWMGLVEGRRQRALFAALLSVGGCLGAFVPWLVEGSFRFAGIGMPMGVVAALALYLALSLLRRRKPEAEDSYRQIVLIALFSALIAHFIEVQSGIPVVSTRTYFWLYAALMVAVALFLREEPKPAPAEVPPAKRRKRRRRKKRRPAARVRAPGVGLWNTSLVSRSLLMGLILMTLGFAHINNQYPLSANGFCIPILFLLTWLFGGLIVLGEVSRGGLGQERAGWASSLLAYSLCSLGPFLLFLLLHTPHLPPEGDPATAMAVYYLCLFAFTVALAAILAGESPLPSARWRRANWWVYPILMAGVALLVWATNLSVVRADIYCNQGLAYGRLKEWDDSIALHRRAVAVAPHEDRYYLHLSQAYLRKAEVNPAQRLACFEEARKILEWATKLSPLNPDHWANLGCLYYYWAQVTPNPAGRIEKLNKALDYCRQVRALSPHNHGRLIEERVIEIYFLLGNSYIEMEQFEQAAEAYTQAVGVNSQKALRIARKAVENSPDNYASHRKLAMVYQQLGRTDKAMAEWKKARELAPEGKRAAVDRLIAWLEAHGN